MIHQSELPSIFTLHTYVVDMHLACVYFRGHLASVCVFISLQINKLTAIQIV